MKIRILSLIILFVSMFMFVVDIKGIENGIYCDKKNMYILWFVMMNLYMLCILNAKT